MIIDMHSHSTASDGTKSPAELIQMGLSCLREASGPAYMALTDHDTVAGIEEYLLEASHYPDQIHAIAGIEFSTYYKNQTIHMLGYNIDRKNPELLASLERYRQDRDSRNDRIIARLQETGFSISMEDIQPLEEGTAVGRPAIAMHMMKMGYVCSVKEAFDLYIGEGRPCHVPRYKPDLQEVIHLIHAAGGIAVLAHPILYTKLDLEEMEALLSMLKAMGLDGLEVYYSKNTPEYTAYCESLAESYRLIATGGSDYHGDAKPDIQLFTGRGDLHVPEDIFRKWTGEYTVYPLYF